MEKIVKWRMAGKRGYLWNRRFIKPGQSFEALESALPNELKSQLVRLSEVTPVIIPVPPVEKPITYRMRMREEGIYDIKDSNGKKINEKDLTREEAQVMLNSLRS
jgi:hypothetical protein